MQIEQLSLRVERADNERRAAATNEHILQLLQSFKEEFSLREDRLLANVSDLIETNRAETLNVVRNALNENSVAVENSIQANHQVRRISELTIHNEMEFSKAQKRSRREWRTKWALP